MDEQRWTYKIQENLISRYRPVAYVIFSVLVLSGLWFMRSGGAPDTAQVAGPLAQLSGVLGGLTLLAHLISKQDFRVRRDLTWISLLLIIATASFALLGVYSPESFSGKITERDFGHDPIADVSFAIGWLSFSTAISYLVLLIGRLNEVDVPSSPAEPEE